VVVHPRLGGPSCRLGPGAGARRLRARRDQIEHINTEHIRVAAKMRELAEEAMPAAAAVLRNQPHALQEWMKTAAKIERDAAGIAEPDKRVVVAGDPDSPVQHELEVQAAIRNMDPALMLKFRELSLELAMVKAREAANVQRPAALPPRYLDG